MTTRAADDSVTIARRLAELEAERLAAFKCVCEWRINAKGERIPIPIADCPLHAGLHRELIAAAHGVRVGDRPA